MVIHDDFMHLHGASGKIILKRTLLLKGLWVKRGKKFHNFLLLLKMNSDMEEINYKNAFKNSE